jgi:hypothetical protein
VAWQRPVVSTPSLSLASDGPLSWPSGLDAAEDGHDASGDGDAAGDDSGGALA